MRGIPCPVQHSLFLLLDLSTDDQVSRCPGENRPAKFSSLKSLTLFFPSNRGADTSRIYFLGLKGEFSAFTREPVVTVYEAQANPADHKKIPGLEGVGREL